MWNIPLISLIFLRFLVFPILLFSSIFFAQITEEGFFISPCYSLELCIQMGISFLFSFAQCWSGQQRLLGTGAMNIREEIPDVQGQELRPMRRYPMSKVRSWRPWGDISRPISGTGAKRRYPMSKVRNRGPWGDTPHPRSGVVTVLCGTGRVEIPHVQVQRNPRKMVGAGEAVRRHPTRKAIASQIYLSRLLFVLDYGPARFFFFTC